MTVAIGSYLELLLASDPDVGDFDEPLVRARADGAPPDRLACLERERALALRVREILIGHRRHQAELQLLNDTAHDLAALHDLDAILQAISDRARRLLECDVAYISLSDRDRGDSYIKAASGNISGLLRELRLPSGAGVGGMVARTGAPYSVLSYHDDKSIIHTAEIDRTVRAEKMVSLLGVPVVLGQHVIGVLLAAHREQRTFSGRDVGALSMLAAHAAVAIDNSRLLGEARAAANELRVANTTIRSHAEALERSAALHERLTRLVLDGKGVNEVVQAAAHSVGVGGVALVNRDGTVVTREGDAAAVEAADLVALARAAREAGYTVVGDTTCAVPMITESDYLGTMVLVGETAIGDIDRRTLEATALVASLVLVTRQRLAETEAQVRGELLEDLLSPSPGRDDLLRHRASLLGVDLDARHVVVVARVCGGGRERYHSAAATLARRGGGLATCRKDEVVLLLPGAEPGRQARVASRELSTATRPVTAGAAAVESIERVAEAYREAADCAQAMLALDRVGEGADTSELGAVGVLFGSRRDLGSFVDSVLGCLIDYDKTRGADLVRTLSAYCASGQSVSTTAQELHLHANTIAQRLSRIGRLLGGTWREPGRLLEVQIALQLLRISRPELVR
ncbi:helix-turn-helix domain-containing protein [Lentzea californiensis]|uniref:helix-turn-helix domain-containing protein n=1 Tax=Lentzea californiensis TaxID=438851 RepID=UPI002166ABC4|nr:GAF domain-containing protein [Lentzea californiensis]